jgi:hypothetical protein
MGFRAVPSNCNRSVSSITQITEFTKRFTMHDFNLCLKHSLKRSYGGGSKLRGIKILTCPVLVNQYANVCRVGSKQLLVFCSIHMQKCSMSKYKVVSD